MKVLFVAPRYHTNQVPLVRELTKAGHEVSFWSQYVGKIEDHDAIEPVLMGKSVITSIMSSVRARILDDSSAELENMKKFIPSPFWIYRELIKLRPDIVITREKNRVSRVISLTCRYAGIKNLILYVQDPYFNKQEKKNIRQKIKSKILPAVVYTPIKRRLDQTPTIEHGRHDYFVPFVYNNITSIHDEYCKDGVLHILAVGKYRDYKNLKVIAEAMHLLEKKSDVDVTIMGQCKSDDERKYKSDLQGMIDQYDLQDKIHLMDDVPYSEMPGVYEQYDMLMLPSKAESAGMVILEAMGNGLGVICSKSCGLAFCVEEAEAGGVFDYADAKQLAAIIDNYGQNKEKVSQAAQNAIKYVRENCSFDAYKVALNNLIEKEFKCEQNI